MVEKKNDDVPSLKEETWKAALCTVSTRRDARGLDRQHMSHEVEGLSGEERVATPTDREFWAIRRDVMARTLVRVALDEEAAVLAAEAIHLEGVLSIAWWCLR